jgi:hypothetical protein
MNEIEELKKVFDLNQKNLKNIIEYNYKLRYYLFKFLTEFFNNDENKEYSLKNIFEMLKAREPIILGFDQNYNKIHDFRLNFTHEKLLYKSFEDFIKQNNENNDSIYFQEKSTFINAFFKGFFNIDKDQTMKDFLKEEIKKKMVKVFSLFIDSQDISHTLRRLENPMFTNTLRLEDILNDIKFPNIKNKIINYSQNINECFKCLYIKIENVCLINLQLSYSNNYLKDFSLTVGGLKEHSNFLVSGFGKRNYPNSFKSKKILSKSKSKFLLFNKIETLFKDFFEKMLKRFNNHLFQCIIILIKYASKYSNLFKKKCAYCEKIIKYNSFDNTLFPPFLCFYLDKELFYHEDCLNISRNQSA